VYKVRVKGYENLKILIIVIEKIIL